MPKLVLVIDDERPIRELLTSLLSEEGWQTRGYASASEALNDIQRDGTPDLVLVDMRMPGMTGWEFVGAVRQHDPSIPVVVMTAARDARRWAEEVRADGYLPKPFDIDRAVGEVERLIGRSDDGDGAFWPPLSIASGDALQRLGWAARSAFCPPPPSGGGGQGRPSIWSTGA